MEKTQGRWGALDAVRNKSKQIKQGQQSKMGCVGRFLHSSGGRIEPMQIYTMLHAPCSLLHAPCSMHEHSLVFPPPIFIISSIPIFFVSLSLTSIYPSHPLDLDTSLIRHLHSFTFAESPFAHCYSAFGISSHRRGTATRQTRRTHSLFYTHSHKHWAKTTAPKKINKKNTKKCPSWSFLSLSTRQITHQAPSHSSSPTPVLWSTNQPSKKT